MTDERDDRHEAADRARGEADRGDAVVVERGERARRDAGIDLRGRRGYEPREQHGGLVLRARAAREEPCDPVGCGESDDDGGHDRHGERRDPRPGLGR